MTPPATYPLAGVDLSRSMIIGGTPFYDCNTGGPRSRTRREMIHSTLLGDRSRFGYWNLAMSVALRFPRHLSPRNWAYEQLERLGFVSPEEARRVLAVPRTVLACKTLEPVGLAGKPSADLLPDEQALISALILGSCSAHLYDPERPVIWTNRALLRPVFLYQVGDFYAE